MGFGLDLSKAKTIQQETLEKNEQIIQRAKENVMATQQQEGASLSINIQNLAKVKEVQNDEEVPLIRRGDPEIP